MGASTQSDADDVVSEINVTPLVDVMMVLLVVFIVTAPLLNNAVKVNLPQTSTTSPIEQKSKAVNVSVDSAGKVYVDTTEVALAGLEEQLKSRRLAEPDLSVHLNADQAVNYGLVAKVMSSVDRAGVTKLSVLTANE